MKLDNNLKSSAVIMPFDNADQNTNRIMSSKPSIDLNKLLAQDENKVPGKEIHIIKKPV